MIKIGSKSFGESWVNFILFTGEDARGLESRRDAIEAAEDHTGMSWRGDYSSPGGSFAHDAGVKRVGQRVLVTQTCGLDV